MRYYRHATENQLAKTKFLAFFTAGLYVKHSLGTDK